MTLAALLGGVVMLGGIATLLWAHCLSGSTAGTSSDQYLRLLTGMLQVRDDDGPLGDEASRLSAMRAALQRNATPRGVSSAFVDPSFSSVQNDSRLRQRASRASAGGLQLSDWQRRRWAQLTQQQQSQRPPEQQPEQQQPEQQQGQQPPPPPRPPRPPPRPPPPPSPPPRPLASDVSTAKARCIGDECPASSERFTGEPMPLHKQAAGGWLSRCTRTFKVCLTLSSHGSTSHGSTYHGSTCHGSAYHGCPAYYGPASYRGQVPTTLGKSEYWRSRRNFSYYKHLYCVVARYAAGANLAIDVGSALPPFVNTFGWIEHRTILGPYFAGNVAKDGGGIHGERYP